MDRGDVPENVSEIIASLGVYRPDEIPGPLEPIYEAAENGCCMLCLQGLGDEATVTVNRLGAIMVFCSQLCLTDMMVKGFLEELYDDLAEKIRFRQEGERG